MTGLALQPTQDYQQSKSKGLATGAGKGILGAFLKPIAGKVVVTALEAHTESQLALGLWGLAGYPLDGLHKHVRRSVGLAKSKDIIQSRITQGVKEMFAASAEEQNMVIQTWSELQNSTHSKRNLE